MAQEAYVVAIGFPSPNMADFLLRAYVEPDMGAADPPGQAKNDVAQTLQDLQGNGFDVRGLQILGVERVT